MTKNVISWFTTDAAGDLGSFLGGVGSVAAFGATLVLIWREMRARRRIEDERAAERRNDERRQARLVFASLSRAEIDGTNPSGQPHAASEPANWLMAVEVTNYSQEPIHEAQVTVPGVEGGHFVIGRVGPGEKKSNVGYRYAPATWQVQHVGCGGPTSRTTIDLDVAFVDNSDRIWRRDGREEPQPLTALPAPY